MRSRKKLITGVLCGIGCAVLLGVGLKQTLAYFTDSEQLTNHLTVGWDTTELEEDFPDPDPVEPDKEMIYTKQVSVSNENAVPVYVRVLVSCSDEYLLPYLEYLELDEEAWARHGVYYYYRTPLQPGEETSPLFTSVRVTVPSEVILDSQTEFSVFCYEESVQVQHGSELFDDYEEAWEYYLGGPL